MTHAFCTRLLIQQLLAQPPILRRWPPVTFSCSPDTKRHSKKTVLNNIGEKGDIAYGAQDDNLSNIPPVLK